MNRADLIERKEAVRAEIAAIGRQLARVQQHPQLVGQIAALEARRQALMAEEHDLRLQIDRAR
ncbi:MAG: hypothetical protein AUK03_03075 [Anaerolineae bacterium CG2_30_64_16]|nr:MAG: hypothetical protein AUK03_03075 [Anaerolineae bacterium CG2_30_64_16]